MDWHPIQGGVEILLVASCQPTTSSSNQWTRTLYQGYLYCTAKSGAKALKRNQILKFICRKQILKFIWNTLKYWWCETYDEILPVIAQFLWTLRFIFSRYHRKYFWRYFRQVFCSIYSTLNKSTQFWLVESSTINPRLYSVGVPIKFPWKRRNFVECTINKKSHDLLVQFVNNRYSWFWKLSNCTRLKAPAILRTFKITRTY